MQLLTIEEASEIPKLSRSTLYTYVARATIPFAKIGSHVRFDADELGKWVAERSHGKNTLLEAEALEYKDRG
jgi:excisionase family DNA binding protein